MWRRKHLMIHQTCKSKWCLTFQRSLSQLDILAHEKDEFQAYLLKPWFFSLLGSCRVWVAHIFRWSLATFFNTPMVKRDRKWQKCSLKNFLLAFLIQSKGIFIFHNNSLPVLYQEQHTTLKAVRQPGFLCTRPLAKWLKTSYIALISCFSLVVWVG